MEAGERERERKKERELFQVIVNIFAFFISVSSLLIIKYLMKFALNFSTSKCFDKPISARSYL